MHDRERHVRRRWGVLALLLVLALVAWQGAQAIAIGALGVPGLYLVPLNGGGQRPETAATPREPEVGEAWRKEIDKTPAQSEQPKVAGLPPEPAPGAPSDLPSRDELARWIRSEAREFVGGVDDKGNILYRFDVWLELPDDMRWRAVSVAYAYDAPSATPASQVSEDRKTGFRVKFGGAACAERVTVTVTFADGRTQDVDVNGCHILN